MPRSANTKVDWKTLKTARGAATRVPALVKSVATGKSDMDRGAAAHALREGLHADGAVAAATAPTVSLLLDVVKGGDGADFALQLIGEAVSAGHLRYLANPRGEIGGPATAVEKVACEGRESLLAALEHEDPRVRSAAAFALAFIPGLAEPARAALRRRLPLEDNEDASISEALALALLEPSAQDFPAPRFASAAAAGSIARGAPSMEGARELATRIGAPIAPTMPWGYGAPEQALTAIAAGTNRRREVAAGVLDALDAATPPLVWSAAARLALQLGEFKQRWQEWDVALPEELSDTQRAIAVALTRQGGLQGLGFGVPRSVRDRRRWLGIAPRGALEKVIESGANRWPVWKVWQTLGTRPGVVDFPQPIIDALSADELLEAYGEVCGGAYGINANRVNPPIQPVLDALPKVTDKALAWARAYWSEMTELLRAQSAPELGGALGIGGAAALYLAFLSRGEPVPSELHQFFPASVVDHNTARSILQLAGPQGEEILWTWMSQPRLAEAHKLLARAAVPLLQAAPSKRIAERLIAAVRASKGLPPGQPEELLAQIKAVAETSPAVAEALG